MRCSEPGHSGQLQSLPLADRVAELGLSTRLYQAASFPNSAGFNGLAQQLWKASYSCRIGLAATSDYIRCNLPIQMWKYPLCFKVCNDRNERTGVDDDLGHQNTPLTDRCR